jgi:hypothetical protein
VLVGEGNAIGYLEAVVSIPTATSSKDNQGSAIIHLMKRFKEKPKMYIVRKYIKATDVKQALRKEPKTAVHDLWIDNEWRSNELASAIGFDDGVVIEEEE